jgi:guanylate kinase
MGNVVALVTGPSASGKSTLQSALLAQGWGRPVNFTTRAMRHEDELDEYVFIDELTFAKKARRGHFAEWTYYDKNLYAMTRYLDAAKNLVIVVDPIGKGAFEAFLIKQNRPFFTVWVECPDEVRLARMEKRRSSAKSVYERMNDSTWMKKVNPLYDLVIDGTVSAEISAQKVIEFANTRN